MERQTPFFVFRVVRRRTKEAVANAIAMMRPLKDTIKTVTFGDGGEFADHAWMSKALTCKIYFAKPYHT